MGPEHFCSGPVIFGSGSGSLAGAVGFGRPATHGSVSCWWRGDLVTVELIELLVGDRGTHYWLVAGRPNVAPGSGCGGIPRVF